MTNKTGYVFYNEIRLKCFKLKCRWFDAITLWIVNSIVFFLLFSIMSLSNFFVVEPEILLDRMIIGYAVWIVSFETYLSITQNLMGVVPLLRRNNK